MSDRSAYMEYRSTLVSMLRCRLWITGDIIGADVRYIMSPNIDIIMGNQFEQKLANEVSKNQRTSIRANPHSRVVSPV